MRILILANSSAGLFDFRGELLERLLQKHELTVSIPDTVKVRELEAMGCEIVSTPINRRGMNPWEDYQLFRAYGKLLKRLKPALVLSYTIKPNIYGGLSCRMNKIPFLVTITGLGNTFYPRGWSGKMRLKMIVYLYRLSLRRASCIFYQNEENKEIFEKYKIRGRSSRLVPGSGVNLRKHRMEPYPMNDEFRFLYVGRVMWEKGIEEYLQAAAVLHDENVHFQIVGYCDEDYQERLDELERQGIIELLGFQTQIHDFLAQASAIVVPTYHEGMSNVLMEASSTGRPVLASQVSGSLEVFAEGETGLGFRPADAEDLIRALRQFMAIPAGERALMGRRGREKMGKEFDRTRVVDAYMEETEKAIGRDRKSNRKRQKK